MIFRPGCLLIVFATACAAVVYVVRPRIERVEPVHSPDEVRLRRFATICGFSMPSPPRDQVVWARNLFSEMNPDATVPSGEEIFKALENSDNVKVFLNELPSLASDPPAQPTDDEYRKALSAVVQPERKYKEAFQSAAQFKAAWLNDEGLRKKPFGQLGFVVHRWQSAILAFAGDPAISAKLDQNSVKAAQILAGSLSVSSTTSNDNAPADPSHPLEFVTVKDCFRWVKINAFLTKPSDDPAKSCTVDLIDGYAAAKHWPEDSWDARIDELHTLASSPLPSGPVAELIKRLNDTLVQSQ